MQRPIAMNTILNLSLLYTKKAWVAVLLPVPRLEALALPIAVRTSNAEAHADMIYYTPIPYTIIQ